MWTLKGINSEMVVSRRQVNLYKALDMAENIESVDKQTLAMKNGLIDKSGLVHKVSPLNTTYYRCSKLNHTVTIYKDCLKCGKRTT